MYIKYSLIMLTNIMVEQIPAYPTPTHYKNKVNQDGDWQSNN